MNLINQLLEEKRITQKQAMRYELFTHNELAAKFFNELRDECFSEVVSPDNHGLLAYTMGRHSVVKELIFDLKHVNKELELINGR